ncbi:1,4-dihydroxy-2-naphthoate polyprenyltransferase [Clostridium lacusfryxellense]|uniref:1,4-dihydroxy-2-naphthoate polyprenyltransferase n=1 Tax=Clostridium lacusfryxellense TaxID=205328 RepID=UPI001C0E06E4|nr:1,4-dihydroxy-2-naphthoate polyprenyltransferase [Clostridium lacusfryxellense]MBU3114398.1 1,4-dihydroxy-2-naphthoate polyprenyltransferase [Clostridium lacusfryxellense]
MSLTNFFKFIEIQTKLASMIPFIIGTLYSIYRFKSFIPKNFIIMGISLLAFDMATTAINNYIDYIKDLKHYKEDLKKKYDYDNKIVKYGIKESLAIGIIFILLAIAIFCGILLTLNTNIIVLFIGIISFIAGILYTYGPIPISRMPLGEIFSGFFMGFVILFLSCYIHIFNSNILIFSYSNSILNISINLVEVLYIFLISIPTISGIANIMLANNICDLEEDINNNRYTLPYYLGKKNALTLFKYLYYISYLDIIVLVLLKVTPMISLLVLLTIIPIYKNIKLFHKSPIKSETFILSVKNFAIMNLTHILAIGIALVFN